MFEYSFVAVICFLLQVFVQGAPEGRIVGGWQAAEGQFPYQALLLVQTMRRVTRCSGAIISQNYILTAAHCLHQYRESSKKYPLSAVTVIAGTTDAENGGVRVQVSEITFYPDYFHNETVFGQDDIALVRLAEALDFSETIKPIALSKRSVPEGIRVVVSGWGRMGGTGIRPNKLRWTLLSSISKEHCESAARFDIGKSFCLGHYKVKGTCSGDSGAPAVAHRQLMGVAKTAPVACGSRYPDIFADVAKYYQWIKSNSDA